MQAGLLNERIEFYKPVTETNEYGEQVQTYNKVNETKAQVINKGSRRENDNNEIHYSNNKTIRIRRYHNIDETYRIGYQKKMYRILSIRDDRKFNEKELEIELINE